MCTIHLITTYTQRELREIVKTNNIKKLSNKSRLELIEILTPIIDTLQL
jgi:hypothetical protein